MSSTKTEDTASEIPKILRDTKNDRDYQRMRFFGKVSTTQLHVYFILFDDWRHQIGFARSKSKSAVIFLFILCVFDVVFGVNFCMCIIKLIGQTKMAKIE